MLHTIAGLITYLSILIGIRLWPGHEDSVCCCAYTGIVLFYAGMLAIQFYKALRSDIEETATFDDEDLRNDLPGFHQRAALKDMRHELPMFNNRGRA